MSTNAFTRCGFVADQVYQRAKLAFTTPGFIDKTPGSDSTAAGKTSGAADASKPPEDAANPSGAAAEAQITKDRNDIMHQNDVTISVSWSGGGQDLKSCKLGPVEVP